MGNAGFMGNAGLEGPAFFLRIDPVREPGTWSCCPVVERAATLSTAFLRSPMITAVCELA